jgi:hypothetical protein
MLDEKIYLRCRKYSMSLKYPKIYFAFFVLSLVIAAQACSTIQTPSHVATDHATQSQPSIAESSNVSVPAGEIQNKSLAKIPNPAMESTPSPTPPTVTVTILNGDLSIRTGPDISFDAIAKLQDGDTVTALARSIMDGWVQIQIPSQAGKMGWISIQTNYSIVTGNLLDLPRIDIVEWNVGSYLNNCTSHQMIVKPGGKILQPVESPTENGVWFTPGTYSVFDMDVDGQPIVANLTVLEHREYNIRKDGNGQRSDCPQPLQK